MADYELRLEHPNAVRFTLRMTLSLADWIKLRDSFGNVQMNRGTNELREAIHAMVRQAETTFGYEPPVEPKAAE